jgi:transcriptional regulator with XRE-family HTH domain
MVAANRARCLTKGSVTLRMKLRKRLATRELARRLKKGTDLISRWANGDRKPVPSDRALLEDDPALRIPWRWWDEELSERQAVAFAKALESGSGPSVAKAQASAP